MIVRSNHFPLLYGIPHAGNAPRCRRKGNLHGSNEEIDMMRVKYPSVGQLLLPCSIVNLLIYERPPLYTLVMADQSAANPWPGIKPITMPNKTITIVFFITPPLVLRLIQTLHMPKALLNLRWCPIIVDLVHDAHSIKSSTVHTTANSSGNVNS